MSFLDYYEIVLHNSQEMVKMVIKRTLEKYINKLSTQFKVVLLTGARQVGKSTLLKICGENRDYVTLDDIDERQMAINDPKLFLEKHKPPVTIDEIQYAPNLLSYIKIAVDNSDKNGQYWLTGSQQFHMMKNVSESLAGRVAIVDLYGFSLKELDKVEHFPFMPIIEFIEKSKKISKPHDLLGLYEKIWRGSYPKINVDTEISWKTFYKSYLGTYIERDIRDLKVIKNEMDFLKFMGVVAARTGQMLNYADISNEVGVSLNTVKSWISILVSSNIVYLLPPYFNNLNKRMVKTPKLYFLDTGLCSFLTNWNSPEALESGAMSGAMLETFIVGEILKSYAHNSDSVSMYYYRDKEKREIDIVIDCNGKLYPIEIKKTANPDKKAIKNFSVIPYDRMGEGALIYMGQDYMPITDNINAIPVSYL